HTIQYICLKRFQYIHQSFQEFAPLLYLEILLKSTIDGQILSTIVFELRLFADGPDNHRHKNNEKNLAYEFHQSKQFFRLSFYQIRILYPLRSNRVLLQFQNRADTKHGYIFLKLHNLILKRFLSIKYLLLKCLHRAFQDPLWLLV